MDLPHRCWAQAVESWRYRTQLRAFRYVCFDWAVQPPRVQGAQQGSARKRMLGATNSSWAATVRISSEPAAAVRRNRP
jgi:hypothetical protein